MASSIIRQRWFSWPATGWTGSDVTAPVAVENLSATDVPDESIDLEWDAVTDAHHYEVWRAPNVEDAPGVWARIGTPRTTTFSDTSIASVGGGAIFHYRVRAVDATGNKGEYALADPTPHALTPPAAPEDLAAESTIDVGIALDWAAVLDYADDPVDGYEVWRAPDVASAAGEYALIASPTEPEHLDDEIAAEAGVYWYKVLAVDSRGVKSDFSTPVSEEHTVS